MKKLYVVSYPFQVYAESENDAILKVEDSIREMTAVYLEFMAKNYPELIDKLEKLYPELHTELTSSVKNVSTDSKSKSLIEQSPFASSKNKNTKDFN